MVGKPSSSPSSPAIGSRGLIGFVRSLGREPARFALRFLALFVLLSAAWSVVAPAYARMLALVAGLAAPALESEAGVSYDVKGSKIVALRLLPPDLAHQLTGESAGTAADSLHGSPRVRQGLWEAGITFNVALLAAALLASPGFSARARVRAVVFAVAGLASSHLIHLLANVVYTQARFAEDAAARLGQTPPPIGIGARAAAVVSFFFDSIGAGFFTILLYVVLIAWLWPDGRRAPATRARRRASRQRGAASPPA